jgi:cation transport ATPase
LALRWDGRCGASARGCEVDQLLDQVPVNYAGPREWTQGIQIEIRIGHVRADEIVIVPPGEQIPVTGTVIAGHD